MLVAGEWWSPRCKDLLLQLLVLSPRITSPDHLKPSKDTPTRTLKMLLYTDVITGDEMLSDGFDM